MIKEILGPEATYKQYEEIVTGFKKLCEEYPNFIFSQFSTEGIALSNARLMKEAGSSVVNPSEYKDAQAKFLNFLDTQKISEWKTQGLAELLYCMGETKLAERIDFDLGPEAQENPEGKFVCRFPKV